MNQPERPTNYEVQPQMLPNSTLAIVSLVSALLGFSVFPLLGGIVALITGYMARKETRAVPATHSGDGLATAGIIMGWIQIGLTVVGICCFAAWFVFVVVLGVTSNR